MHPCQRCQVASLSPVPTPLSSKLPACRKRQTARAAGLPRTARCVCPRAHDCVPSSKANLSANPLDERWTSHRNDGKDCDIGRDPKTIDNLHESGAQKGKKQYGIYKLEGDKLTVCMTRPGVAEGDRPKDFSTKDTANVVFVFERPKEDKKP